MWHKKIIKTDSSEWIVRNSLYWMSSFCRWKLEQNDDYWLITFDTFSDEIQFEFERLLNDYSLREKLHAQTYRIRNSIIDNVLKSIDMRLTK
ncbi:His-Xaa-Ser system protein HxsD [Yersinia sp. Marseille-Q5920]|uniref:His-Xaa-Ser system protein HxsD n=1 Tax=Yersinia sp. Marseille-Q5920 TaxID=2972785 RepID=UPI0022653F2C|nr:His-Xaa-Ser system protein HxsD [Yersinia sp. Marseille-Q5920]